MLMHLVVRLQQTDAACRPSSGSLLVLLYAEGPFACYQRI
jgi:hypothetical protein